MTRHFGFPGKPRPVPSPATIGKLMLAAFLGFALLSFCTVWFLYRPSGVERYGSAFVETKR